MAFGDDGLTFLRNKSWLGRKGTNDEWARMDGWMARPRTTKLVRQKTAQT